MKPLFVFLCYFFMLIFDLAIAAGTIWLISEKGWSPFWILVAYVLMVGSNPRNFIAMMGGR